MFPTYVWCIVCDSINRLGDLDLEISSRVTRVMGFRPANFHSPVIGRGTRQTDKRTIDRQTPAIIL